MSRPITLRCFTSWSADDGGINPRKKLNRPHVFHYVGGIEFGGTKYASQDRYIDIGIKWMTTRRHMVHYKKAVDSFEIVQAEQI